MHQWKGCLHCWMPAHRSHRRAKAKRSAPSIAEITRNMDSTPPLPRPAGRSDTPSPPAPPGRLDSTSSRRRQPLDIVPVSSLVSDLLDLQHPTFISCTPVSSTLTSSTPTSFIHTSSTTMSTSSATVIYCRTRQSSLPGLNGHVYSSTLVEPTRPRRPEEARYVDDPTDDYIALTDCYSGPLHPAPPPPKPHGSFQIPIEPRLPGIRSKKSSTSSLPSSPPMPRAMAACGGLGVPPPLPLSPAPPDLSHSQSPPKKGSLKKFKASLLDLVILPPTAVGSKHLEQQRSTQEMLQRSAANEEAWKLLQHQQLRQKEQLLQREERKQQLLAFREHQIHTLCASHENGYADARIELARVCGSSSERLRPSENLSQNSGVGSCCGSPSSVLDALSAQYIPMNSCSTPSSNPSRISFSPMSNASPQSITSPLQNSRSQHRSGVDHRCLPRSGLQLVDPNQNIMTGVHYACRNPASDLQYSIDAMIHGNSQAYGNSQPGNDVSDYEVMISPQVRALQRLSLTEESTSYGERPESDNYTFDETLVNCATDDKAATVLTNSGSNSAERGTIAAAIPTKQKSRKSSLEHCELETNGSIKAGTNDITEQAEISSNTLRLLHKAPPAATLLSNDKRLNRYVNDQVGKAGSFDFQPNSLEFAAGSSATFTGGNEAAGRGLFNVGRPRQVGIDDEEAVGWMTSSAGPVKEDYYNIPSPKKISKEKSGDIEVLPFESSASKPPVGAYPSFFASPCWSQRSDSLGDPELPRRRREQRKVSSSGSDDDSCGSASGGCNSSSSEPSPTSRSPVGTNRLAAPNTQNSPHPTVYRLANPPKRTLFTLSSVPPPPCRHDTMRYLDIDHDKSGSQSEAEKTGSGRLMPPREAHIDYAEIDCGKTAALTAIKLQLETERSNNRKLIISG